MIAAYWMVAGYVAWTIVLLLMMASTRFCAFHRGQVKRVSGFSPFGDEISPYAHRVHRAHANCYENIGLMLAVVLLAFMMGKIDMLNGLAYVFLGARVLQSLVHISSGRGRAVMVRFFFFVVQIAILIYWLICLVTG